MLGLGGTSEPPVADDQLELLNVGAGSSEGSAPVPRAAFFARAHTNAAEGSPDGPRAMPAGTEGQHRRSSRTEAVPWRQLRKSRSRLSLCPQRAWDPKRLGRDQPPFSQQRDPYGHLSITAKADGRRVSLRLAANHGISPPTGGGESPGFVRTAAVGRGFAFEFRAAKGIAIAHRRCRFDRTAAGRGWIRGVLRRGAHGPVGLGSWR